MLGALPFSESLLCFECLCEENNDVDIVCETKPHVNVQNKKETALNGGGSHDLSEQVCKNRVGSKSHIITERSGANRR